MTAQLNLNRNWPVCQQGPFPVRDQGDEQRMGSFVDLVGPIVLLIRSLLNIPTTHPFLAVESHFDSELQHVLITISS